MPTVPSLAYPPDALAGRRVLITGASRGIGRAIAGALAEAGASVVLSARAGQALDQAVAKLRAAGGDAHAVPADLSDGDQTSSLIERAVTQLGGLDVLINNAGLGRYGTIEQFSLADWDAVMQINLRAPFILCQAAIPHLRASSQGTILNIASVVAHKGYVNQGAYSASKHGLLGLTKVLAAELRADGIRVQALCPGAVATEMVTQARPDLDPAALIRPEEIADWVLFLLTRRNAQAVIDDVHLRRATGEPWF